MIKVNVEIKNKSWKEKIKNPNKYFNNKLNKVSKVVPIFKKKKITFTILLTNSFNMKKLNKKFRNLNKPTDVLSFPFLSHRDFRLSKDNNLYIGDIATSYEIIKRRSQKGNFYIEFDKVWIHGLLHLIGYDHIKNKDYLRMSKMEKKILSFIN
jgi:probable rRNA maturation factor